MSQSLNRLLIRFNGWPRRALALACVLAAVVSALHRHRPHGSLAGVSVVVASRDLSIGTTLALGDVLLAKWPAALAPPHGFRTPQAAVGRRLSTPLDSGEPLTLTRVVGTELTAGIGADQVASTVVTATDLSALVHAGDRVDLLAAPVDDPLAPNSGSPASVVARDAQVLAVLPRTEQDSGSGSTLIVATSRNNALVLAAVTGSRILAVVGRPP